MLGEGTRAHQDRSNSYWDLVRQGGLSEVDYKWVGIVDLSMISMDREW